MLKFDISEPENPILEGRTSYDPGADGDAHSLTPYDAGGTRYILQNDEDGFNLPGVLASTSVTGDERYPAVQQFWAPTLLSRGSLASGLLTGRAHDARNGCFGKRYVGAKNKVVLINVVDPFYAQQPCGVGKQVLFAVRAGAKAVMLNLIGPDDPSRITAPDARTRSSSTRKRGESPSSRWPRSTRSPPRSGPDCRMGS
ncbi:MAG: hypothetical protein ABR529_03275 [Actinomycetota bacterium]